MIFMTTFDLLDILGTPSVQVPVTPDILESLRTVKTSLLRSESIELPTFLADMF